MVLNQGVDASEGTGSKKNLLKLKQLSVYIQKRKDQIEFKRTCTER